MLFTQHTLKFTPSVKCPCVNEPLILRSGSDAENHFSSGVQEPVKGQKQFRQCSLAGCKIKRQNLRTELNLSIFFVYCLYQNCLGNIMVWDLDKGGPYLKKMGFLILSTKKIIASPSKKKSPNPFKGLFGCLLGKCFFHGNYKKPRKHFT